MKKVVITSEVLIIGCGAAGLRAAIELHDGNVDIVVVGKCKKRDAHTILATGGINAALGNMDPKDCWQLHAADTIKDGGFINDTIAVIKICRNASRTIKELARWGARFQREKNGKITQRFFGAATYRRACFVGDYTGKEILNVVVNQVNKRKINFKSGVYIFSLLYSKGKVNGALGLDIKNGKIVIFHAKVVVLATGGHSRMFKRSSSRFWENNGDGIALAYDYVAEFSDMEMFQFHPTGMVYPLKAEGTLVTESVRGEGGILTNSKGERFMKKYDPERLELSARDIVARANFNEINSGRGTKHHGVWLDISHKPKSYLLKRLPKMYKQFKEYANVDISKEKMEVAPTAHYSMGGICVDENGRTNIKNLFAIGEVTSGTHGANRLGGNSLLEIMVFGRLTGQNVIKAVKKVKFIPLVEKLIDTKTNELSSLLKSNKGENPIDLKKKIQQVMWEGVGVIRNGKQMKQALKNIQKLKNKKMKIGGKFKMNEKLIAALDVKNMFPTCEMIIKSALFRKESRGAHKRSDYGKTLNNWKKNIVCKPSGKGIKIYTKPIHKVPEEISKYFKKRKKTTLHLLE